MMLKHTLVGAVEAASVAFDSCWVRSLQMCLKIDLKAVSRTGGEGAVRALDVHLGLVLVQGLLAGHRHTTERADLVYAS